MAAPQGLTPEFAAGFRQLMVDGLMRELETTKKVLNAVPDAKSDYRPDPHARTAWELAWHIANTDVQFLDGIADLNFKMETPENKPKSIAELVEWYDKSFKRAADRVLAMSPEQLGTPIDCSAYSIFRRSPISVFSTTMASLAAGSSPPTCDPWDLKCLPFTGAAMMSRSGLQRAGQLLPDPY